MSPRDRNLAAQIGCLAPAKDFSAQDIALGAEQMVAENKLDFLRQHLTGGIGRGTPDLQLQLDAASIAAAILHEQQRLAQMVMSSKSKLRQEKVVFCMGRLLDYFQPQKVNNPLSTRETEVLKLLSDGLSYKMVADKLFLSFNTVNTHVKHIYEKLHVSSLGEAIAFYYKNLHQQ